jgi:hypothetical protein
MKGPEKWKTNHWFSFHDNAPAHRSVLVNVKTLEHLLATADFYLFSRMKSASD